MRQEIFDILFGEIEKVNENNLLLYESYFKEQSLLAYIYERFQNCNVSIPDTYKQEWHKQLAKNAIYLEEYKRLKDESPFTWQALKGIYLIENLAVSAAYKDMMDADILVNHRA